MNWVEKHFGLDWVDVAIQAALTGIGMAIVDEFIRGPFGYVLSLKIAAISILVLAIRRHRALKARRAAERDPEGLTSGQMAAERFEVMEERIGELEERLDFTERLLARATEERLLEPKDEVRHG